MKAMVKARPAPGLELRTLPDPAAGPHDLVVRVKAVSICGGDNHIYDWNAVAQGLGLRLPFIPGHEVAGEIVQLGRNVRGFAIGDRIAVETHIPCGACPSCRAGRMNLCDNLRVFGVGSDGAFAEYAVVPAVVAYRLPDEIPDDHGAVLEPLGVAVHAAERAGLRGGDTVAVLGCGPIGLFTIALARLEGAAEIIATDVSDYRLDLARRMGATRTLNPGRDDVVQAAQETTHGTGADVVVETSASPQALTQAFDLLAKRGTLALIAAHPRTPPLNFLQALTLKEASVVGVYGRSIWESWQRSVELLTSGAIDLRPLLTHRFPLGEIGKAFAVSKTGEAGKVILVPWE